MRDVRDEHGCVTPNQSVPLKVLLGESDLTKYEKHHVHKGKYKYCRQYSVGVFYTVFTLTPKRV